MKTTIMTPKELKRLIKTNRDKIKSINGIELGNVYPLLTVTNKHASYYDVESQQDKTLYPPLVIIHI